MLINSKNVSTIEGKKTYFIKVFFYIFFQKKIVKAKLREDLLNHFMTKEIVLS